MHKCLILVAVLAIGSCGKVSTPQAVNSPDKQEIAETIEAEKLYKTFVDNRVQGDVTYLDKILTVQCAGCWVRLDKDKQTGNYIVSWTQIHPRDAYLGAQLTFHFDADQKERLATMDWSPKGRFHLRMLVRGTLKEYNHGILTFENCQVKEAVVVADPPR